MPLRFSGERTTMTASALAEFLKQRIRTVPDWPQPGVQFRDITTLLANPEGWQAVCDAFAEHYAHSRIDFVAGLEARGFVIAATLAYLLGVGFIPLRKQGKLPFATHAERYGLEYGTATLEVHADACQPGQRVVLVDDLIATGGTLLAGKALLDKLGAEVVGAGAIVDLPDLGGAQRLRDAGVAVFTLCEFAGH